MRISMICGCGLMLAALMVGCGSSSPEETTIKKTFSIMNEMSGVLESVKDGKSMKEAEGKLKALGDELHGQQKKLIEFPKDKMEAVSKKYEKEGTAAMERFLKAFAKAKENGINVDPKLIFGPR